MVELSLGCRHITCQCKAEFCYVCGAPWQTCSCTELDQARRQQEILDRRNINDAEAAETQAAIRAVERAEEAEAAEQVRQAEIQAAEAAEQARVRELEQARKIEGHRKDVDAKFAKLRVEMLEMHNRHRLEMDQRHEQERQVMQEEHSTAESKYIQEMENSQEILTREHQAKADALGRAHAQALEDLDRQQQEEEDDAFLEFTMHLRGKPNREARIKDMTERLAKKQAEKREEVVQEQKVALEKLLRQEDADVGRFQASLQSKERHRRHQASKQSRLQTRRFWADGEWFAVVGEERKRMLDTEKSRQLLDKPNETSKADSPFGIRPPHPLEIEGRMNGNEWGVAY